jgi:hypothetical protein
MDIVCIPLPSGKWKWIDQVDESIVFDDETSCVLADSTRLNKIKIEPSVIIQENMPPQITTVPTIVINPLEAVPFFSKS